MSMVRFRPEAPIIADVAHLVERHLAKVEVAGSSPVIRSIHNTYPILKCVSGFYFVYESYLSIIGTNQYINMHLNQFTDRNDFMIKLYACDIRTLCDPAENQDILSGLSQYRKEKIMRYKFADDRKRSLACGLILKKILPCYGLSESSIVLGKNDKPECDGIKFSVSHSGDYSVAAFSEKNIGCDIEKLRPAPIRIAQSKFADGERDFIFSQKTDKEKDEAFFRIWTLKESYLKYTGDGLNYGLNFFEIVPSSPPFAKINGQKSKCQFFEQTLDGHLISVCCDERELDRNICVLSF